MVLFILVYSILNILFGTFLYIILHKEINVFDLLGFSCVYSIVFLPCFIYFLRILNMDNGKSVLIILCLMIVIIICRLLEKKIIIQKSNLEALGYMIALLLVCVLILLFVNEGLLAGSTYRNSIGDMAKSYGTIISLVGSDGLYIEHPFATGCRMYYYYFYYFRAAEIIKILGGDCSFIVPIWIIFLDSIILTYAIFFLLYKIGMAFSHTKKYIILINTILITDGGFECLWMMFISKNEIWGGVY